MELLLLFGASAFFYFVPLIILLIDAFFCLVPMIIMLGLHLITYMVKDPEIIYFMKIIFSLIGILVYSFWLMRSLRPQHFINNEKNNNYNIPIILLVLAFINVFSLILDKKGIIIFTPGIPLIISSFITAIVTFKDTIDIAKKRKRVKKKKVISEKSKEASISKKEASKVGLYISFLPFVLILFAGINGAINGTKGICPLGGCHTKYGLDAFIFEISFWGLIGAVPCIISIIYIIYYCLDNKK